MDHQHGTDSFSHPRINPENRTRIIMSASIFPEIALHIYRQFAEGTTGKLTFHLALRKQKLPGFLCPHCWPEALRFASPYFDPTSGSSPPSSFHLLSWGKERVRWRHASGPVWMGKSDLQPGLDLIFFELPQARPWNGMATGHWGFEMSVTIFISPPKSFDCLGWPR